MNDNPTIKHQIAIPNDPTIKYPKWLHSDICNKVQTFIDNAIYYKHAPLGIELGIYTTLTNRFNRIKNVFTNIQMKKIWNNLYKENTEKTLNLVYCLFHIENDFDHGIGLRIKHVNELKNAQKIVRITQNLIDAMDESGYFFGHTNASNFNEIFESLRSFKDETSDLIDDFKEHIKENTYMFSQHWPIGRKHDTENSLAIFFIRKLYPLHFKMRTLANA